MGLTPHLHPPPQGGRIFKCFFLCSKRRFLSSFPFDGGRSGLCEAEGMGVNGNKPPAKGEEKCWVRVVEIKSQLTEE